MWKKFRREKFKPRGEKQEKQAEQKIRQPDIHRLLLLLTEDELDHEEVPQRHQQLEEMSRQLIMREEQLFSQDVCSEEEEEEDQLLRDLEALKIQLWMAVQNTFSSSSNHLDMLRSALVSIQQQEDQDQRWKGCVGSRVPAWRPQRCLSTHHRLLGTMVESRLVEVVEEDPGGPGRLSSPLKREVSPRPPLRDGLGGSCAGV